MVKIKLENIYVSGHARLRHDTSIPGSQEQHYLLVTMRVAAENRPYVNETGVEEISLQINQELYGQLREILEDSNRKGMLKIEGNLDIVLEYGGPIENISRRGDNKEEGLPT